MLLWRISRKKERFIALIPVLTITLIFLLFHLSYSYLVVFAPIVAYASGRVIQSRITIMLGVFVLLPAFISASAFDLTNAIQANVNQQVFDDDHPMLDVIPKGTTLVADDRLWFTLYPDRTFIGWNGLNVFRRVNKTDLNDTLNALGVEAVICSSEYAQRCDAIQDFGLFQSPIEVCDPGETYRVYWALALRY